MKLGEVKLAGDLVVAGFFKGDSAKQREAALALFADAVQRGEAGSYRSWLEEQRQVERPLVPFHWELEFPEVFLREQGGFDALVGNPPFAGKNTMAAGNASGYPDWLKALHEGSHGNADLVAHFFRLAFSLLRPSGAFGLIATNTIAQGDTRATGLRWICTHGGEVFCARRRVKWPGSAAVVVSVVHVFKGAYAGVHLLDGKPVQTISAFLFHRGGSLDPARLAANAGKSFQGSIVLGMGFTFDDTDTKGVATPLAEMRRLIEKDPGNAEVILPYIGGEEVNSSPTHAHHRYVINFGHQSEEECRRRWPDLMAIVEEKVKPQRANDNRETRRVHWWRFGETTPALFATIADLDRVLVTGLIRKNHSFCFLEAGMVYAHTMVVLAFDKCDAFCMMQSRVHEIWALFQGSTFEDRPIYTSSSCFETFPFPGGWEGCLNLETAGNEYYRFRSDLMVCNDEGLTKTYNRFNDPEESTPEILRLRELHDEMDRAVLEAYGWVDIPTACEFLLDYEVADDGPGRRKKPYRYRWPDEVRHEILARLLELNAQRAAEERRAGAGSATKRPKRGRVAAPQAGGLF